MKKLMWILSLVIVLTFAISSNSKISYAEKKVESIEITKVPSTCAYNVGDGYSTKGMVVVAADSREPDTNLLVGVLKNQLI